MFVYQNGVIRPSDKNSSRVFGSSRKTPSIADVVVRELTFCAPRMTIHICLEKQILQKNLSLYFFMTYTHSTMTATPRGSIASAIASAICRVKRSCTII